VDRSAALEQLDSMVSAGVAPELAADELGQVLDQAALADNAGNPPGNIAADVDEWTAGKVVRPDTLIVVSARFWRCSVGGTTGASEAAWPTLAGRPVNDALSVVDGSVTWVDNGSEWAPTWDLDKAAALGWERKAAKAVGGFDFKTEDQQFARSQVAKTCLDMADRHRRRMLPAIA